MNIDLALFAYLSQYQPDGLGGRHARAMTFAPGTCISEVISELGLPDQPRVIFLNGKHAEESVVLGEGDRLAIFPPVAGG
ncbi:MAG TPA: MoaD/ThiS family protein [Coriobacteriia bacterium]|nr:MoaD/ThiS family protein [Coriobacteriia bacterium]